VRFAQRLATPRRAVFTMPIRAFTIPIRVFTMRRSWRSRWSDPRVHDRAKSALDADGDHDERREHGQLKLPWALATDGAKAAHVDEAEGDREHDCTENALR
jgi:hypothetical protein